MIVFEVVDLFIHEGLNVAAGRMVSGDLHVGTVFTGLFKEDPSLSNSQQPDVHLNVRAARLLAYEEEWDRIPQGYSAVIELEEGCKLVEEGCFLVAG